MNKVDFKKHFLLFGNDLIDQCFSLDDLVSKLLNTTCKYIYKNKLSEIDPVLNLFANSLGEIDANDFVKYMADNMVGEEGLKINLRDYVNQLSSFINVIPDKTLVIHKEDLQEILRN